MTAELPTASACINQEIKVMCVMTICDHVICDQNVILKWGS